MNKTMEQTLSTVNTTMIDVLDALNNTNPAAKEEFMHDSSLLRPNNQYENLDGRKAEQNITLIDSTLDNLKKTAADEEIILLAGLLLEHNRKCNNIVLQAYLFNNCTPEEKQLYADSFVKAAEELYGTPDETTFYGILSHEISHIDDTASTAPEALFQRINRDKLCQLTDFAISEDQKEQIRLRVEEYCQFILTEIPKGKNEFTVQEASEIANRIIKNDSRFASSAWHAVIVKDATYASVNHFKKELRLPGNRSKGNYTLIDLKKTLVHELGTHILRSLPFEHSKIHYLSHGFPGNEMIDEGIAKLMEFSMDGQYEIPGTRHYLSIGFANFLNMNFREAYDTHITLGKYSPSLCFDSVQRAFRGTGVLPNNKDLVYYNGTVKVLNYVKDNLDKPVFWDSMFSLGKIDFLDPVQCRLARYIIQNKI